MTSRDTHQRLDHETRQHQIVEAARSIIATGGIDALTTRAIAKHVGLTEPALYRHFTSKVEVLLMLISDIRESLFREISQASLSDHLSLDKLEHLLALHLSHVESRRGISFVLITESLQFGEQRVRRAIRELIEDYLNVIKRLVVEGQIRGEIETKLDPSAIATMFFGMIQAAATMWLLDSRGHPLTQNVGGFRTLLRSLIPSHRTARSTMAR